MPSESGPVQAVGELRVAVAPVLEFHFGLYLITKHVIDPEKTVPNWVLDVSQADPEMVGRFGRFWGDRGLYDLPVGGCYGELGEILVVGWRSGTILGPSVEAFLGSLERTLAESFPTPPLESEPAPTWNLIDRRLALLRSSAEDRQQYVELIKDLWAMMRPQWESFGKTGAERAAREIALRSRQEEDLRVLLPGNTFLHKDEFKPLIEAAKARGELVVVPLGLGGTGQLYWALPGLTLLGVGLESNERIELRRERSERAAMRFKVLSDPTRVAILFELLRPHHNAETVTELASLFRLSQPTVSVHIKMLREAGLIISDRDGNQVRYRAEEATVRGYIGEALEDIIGVSPLSFQPTL
ncbi:MAG: metalloregulator ArsR/SmtB family transcription factor [bacterium]